MIPSDEGALTYRILYSHSFVLPLQLRQLESQAFKVKNSEISNNMYTDLGLESGGLRGIEEAGLRGGGTWFARKAFDPEQAASCVHYAELRHRRLPN
ncbi:hypothetical protein LINGRAHAP2_LOCUS27276 [Linum grandiflorum]